jgi:uncharacterized protein (TIGR02246 family)
MKTKSILPIGLILLVTTMISCSMGPKDLKTEIQKANDVFGETYRSNDPDAMAALYTEDCIMYPPDGERIIGRENLRDFWVGVYESGITNAVLTTLSAQGYGNIAIEDGMVDLYVGDMKVGTEKYLVVWHKVNGEWKLHQDMFNSAMPKPDNVSVAKMMYDAFANGDIPGVLAGLDENVVWNEAENFIYADGNPYVGHDAVVNGVFARIGNEWEYWNLEEMEFNEAGTDKVLATGRYKAKHKRTGKKINAQLVHVWTFKDGKATSFQQYTDTKQAARAVR